RNDPNGKLGDAGQGSPDDLAQHQLERLYRGYDDFYDPAGLFLYDAAHDKSTINNNEHHDGIPEPAADERLDLVDALQAFFALKSGKVHLKSFFHFGKLFGGNPQFAQTVLSQLL